MNAPNRPIVPSTRAAEGLPRRKWTLAEIEHLCEIGIFGGVDRERERFELIGGEIVPMSAKGNWHEALKADLNRYWVKKLPDDVALVPETTLRTDANSFLEPDFFIWPRAIPIKEIACTTALLVVEVADSSLAFDSKRKAKLYAGYGVRDYWVINARKRTTTIYRDPAPDGFKLITKHSQNELLVPALVPTLAVRLSDLDAT